MSSIRERSSSKFVGSVLVKQVDDVLFLVNDEVVLIAEESARGER